MKTVVTGANGAGLVRPVAMAAPAVLVARADLVPLEIARPANAVVPAAPGPVALDLKAAAANSPARDAILTAANNANAAKRLRRCRK